ncbi:MAG: hypothetical protein F4056_08070 [Chloroflexi bacterium]|nr:hypothetical protein [Chloroflexota bacterium]
MTSAATPGGSAGPPVLRVVGPQIPARNLLVIALVEALRARGLRTATAELLADGRATVTLPSGGRVTPAPGGAPLDSAAALAAFVASLDPRADLVIAEDYEQPGVPAVELTTAAASPGEAVAPGDLLASVEAERLERDFTARGAEAVAELAERVEARLLRGESAPEGGGLLARLRGVWRSR